MTAPAGALPEMAPFEPFVIADVEVGQFLARQPWLAPHRAAELLENGHVFRGRIVKRPGYELFRELGTEASTTAVGSSGQNLWADGLPNAPVLQPEDAPSTYGPTWTDGVTTWKAVNVLAPGPGNYEIQRTSDSRVDGTLNLATGIWQIDLPGVETFAADLAITWEYNRALPVMGIASFFLQDGTEFLIVCDTRRLWRYDAGQERLVDEFGADQFTGTDLDFFWFQAFEDKLFLSNNTDRPKKYDPSGPTLTDLGTAWLSASPGVNQLDAVSMLFRDQGRIIYLDTTEAAGGRLGTRARVTPVNDVEYAQAPNNPRVQDYYADAPINDTIVTAGWLGSDLYVWFARNALVLEYTGDPEKPYRWRRIPTAEGNPGVPGGGAHGAQARMATLSFGETILTRGRTGILASDGLGISPVDLDIPDFTLGWNQDRAGYTYALLWDEGRRVLWQYADQNEDRPGSALVMQFDDAANPLAGGSVRSWGVYRLPFSCYGYFRQQETLLLDDISDILDTISEPFSSPSVTAGFPLVLAGGRDSKVYILGRGHDDDGANVRFRWRSVRLNPYVQPRKGRRWARAHLGLCAFLVSTFDTTFTVRFYRDLSTTPVKEVTLSRALRAGSPFGGDKVLVWVNVNQVGTWHQVEIEADDANALSIDAVIPFFAPVAGTLRQIT